MKKIFTLAFALLAINVAWAEVNITEGYNNGSSEDWHETWHMTTDTDGNTIREEPYFDVASGLYFYLVKIDDEVTAEITYDEYAWGIVATDFNTDDYPASEYTGSEDKDNVADSNDYTRTYVTGDLVIPETVYVTDEDGTSTAYTVKMIDNSAFAGCKSLDSVTFPATVTTIGDFSFWRSGLKKIYLPNTLKKFMYNSFMYCYDVQSITFDDDAVIELCDFVFDQTGNNAAEPLSVVIPKGITEIPRGAFRYCSNIESVTFADDSKVTTLGRYSFDECTKLKNIELPDKVETIKYRSFYKCDSLETVVLPASVTSIENQSFALNEDNKLKSFYCKATTVPALTDTTAISNTNNAILYVPTNVVETYKTSWGSYFTEVVAYVFPDLESNGIYYNITDETNNYVKIVAGPIAYEGEIELTTEFTLAETTYTVTAIASDAFDGCTGLEVTVNFDSTAIVPSEDYKGNIVGTLHVPDGSEVEYAESDWAKYFTIDGYIEGTTFDDENGLTYEITDQYEKTVEIVEFECSESVEIPVTVDDYTVTEIDEEVFANCSTLKYVTIDATEPPCEASLFANVSEDAVLYVTNIESYAGAGWHDYFLIYGYVEVGDTFVVDNIEYEITNITDGYEVQVIGTTATEEDTIEFVAEVDFNTFTFDVLNIADDAFDGQTALMAEINIIDPEVITLGEIADVSEGKIGKLTVYDGTVNMYEASDWAKYFDIDGYYYLEVDSVYYVFKISSNKASSSKNTITLEVDHVDENATEVTIPRTIDLGDDSSTTSYDVTSMNADALKDCKDLVTINLEASIPAEDIEALNKVPDSVTIVLDEDELGTEYCESVIAAAEKVGIEVKMVSTAIVEVKVVTDKIEVERYNLLGQKINAPVRGINIVKYSDGTVEKVLIK